MDVEKRLRTLERAALDMRSRLDAERGRSTAAISLLVVVCQTMGVPQELLFRWWDSLDTRGLDEETQKLSEKVIDALQLAGRPPAGSA